MSLKVFHVLVKRENLVNAPRRHENRGKCFVRAVTNRGTVDLRLADLYRLGDRQVAVTHGGTGLYWPLEGCGVYLQGIPQVRERQAAKEELYDPDFLSAQLNELWFPSGKARSKTKYCFDFVAAALFHSWVMPVMNSGVALEMARPALEKTVCWLISFSLLQEITLGQLGILPHLTVIQHLKKGEGWPMVHLSLLIRIGPEAKPYIWERSFVWEEACRGFKITLTPLENWQPIVNHRLGVLLPNMLLPLFFD